jgi:hypothetical protein
MARTALLTAVQSEASWKSFFAFGEFKGIPSRTQISRGGDASSSDHWQEPVFETATETEKNS